MAHNTANIQGEEDNPNDALGAVVSTLEKLAVEQVRKKTSIEERWLEDVRQYYGVYDDDTEKRLQNKKSKVFVKLTRNKTLAWEARLSDMLFPTDDKNWGIGPTPVPELSEKASYRPDLDDQEEVDPQQADVINANLEQAEEAQSEISEAKKRAERMELEIEDQLREDRYNIKSRDVIHDMCLLGTGVLKGPLVTSKPRRSWVTKFENGEDDNDGKTPVHVLSEVEDQRPGVQRTDPWNYFPDMSARTTDEREFDFERHLLNTKDFKKQARRLNFDERAVKEVLKTGAKEKVPSYMGALRSIAGGDGNMEDRYLVWEYRGPLSHEDLSTLCTCMGDEDMLADIEDEPLEEYSVVVYFCQGTALKFSLNHMDSGDSIYSVVNFEKDETSIFGFGVPYLMRDSQKSLNGSWRMTLDNGGLSVGPQVVIDKSAVTPENGSWEVTPNKVWLLTDKNKRASDVFSATHIDSRQQQLVEIIALSRQFADDETNFPLVAQGESGSHQTQTAQGLAILQNASNVVFRRVVRNWDDDLTTPTIRRFYDWNMQFSDKEHIKGDFNVDARGSSVLLVREIQAQNLMAITQNWSAHPVLAPLLKVADAARKTVQAHMIAADEIIKTDDELKAEAAAQQQNGGQPDPEMMKLDFQAAESERQRQHEMQIKTMERDITMMQFAERMNMDLEKLKAMLADKKAEREHKERLFVGEVGIKEMTGSGI